MDRHAIVAVLPFSLLDVATWYGIDFDGARIREVFVDHERCALCYVLEDASYPSTTPGVTLPRRLIFQRTDTSRCEVSALSYHA